MAFTDVRIGASACGLGFDRLDRVAGSGSGLSGGADVSDHAALSDLVASRVCAVVGRLAGDMVGLHIGRVADGSELDEHSSGSDSYVVGRCDAVGIDPTSPQDR